MHRMTLNILALIGILITGYIVFHGIRFGLRVYEGKKLIEQSHPFEQNTTTGSPRILVAGDSTAVGTGTTPEGSTAGHFGIDFPDAAIANMSENGRRTAELATIFSTLEQNSFDLIVLQIGANDIIHGTNIDELRASLTQLFQDAKKIGTHVVALHSGNIGLAPIFPWPISTILQSRTQRYREVYKAIAADNGVAYVDLYEDAANDPFKDTKRFYAPDGLHLTADGYGFWYQEIRKVMERLNIQL